MSLLLLGAGGAGAAIPLPDAWWRPEENAGLSDGNEIVSWTDASGHGRVAVGAATARPLYNTSIQNGLAVARFDGVNDLLVVTGYKPGDGLTAEITMAMACKITTATGVMMVNTRSGSTGWQWATTVSMDRHKFDHIGSTSIADVVTTSVWRALTVRKTSVPSTTVAHDAAAGNTAAPAAYTASTSAGMNIGQGVLAWDLGELLIYERALSAAELAQVAAYLKTRWATP